MMRDRLLWRLLRTASTTGNTTASPTASPTAATAFAGSLVELFTGVVRVVGIVGVSALRSSTATRLLLPAGTTVVLPLVRHP